MGFYNTNTVEEKRVNKLTGDIHINDAFKELVDLRIAIKHKDWEDLYEITKEKYTPMI